MNEKKEKNSTVTSEKSQSELKTPAVRKKGDVARKAKGDVAVKPDGKTAVKKRGELVKTAEELKAGESHALTPSFEEVAVEESAPVKKSAANKRAAQPVKKEKKAVEKRRAGKRKHVLFVASEAWPFAGTGRTGRGHRLSSKAA